MAKEFDVPAAGAAQIVALVDSCGSLTPLGSGSHGHLARSADLAGKVLWELVHPNDIAAVRSAVSEVMATGAPREIRFRMPGDASRWHTLEGTVERTEGDARCQARVAATLVEDTEDAEPRASDPDEQLRRADKLEVLGRLAGGISHDFGNLLTVILNDIERVLEALPADSGVRVPAESVLSAAERAAGMVRHLLAFSRPHSPAPAVLDVNELLDHIEPLLRRLVGEQVTLRIIRCADLWPITADRTQIEQVVINLAVNARDAMPRGGVLTIETRNLSCDEVVALESRATVECAAIVVSDTGTGMDQATRSRAFDPFFTTKEAGQGTGLGLSTVRQIATDSGGWIHLASRERVGTMVTFGIPRAHGIPAAAREREIAAEGGTETLLVVEDEARVRELVADMLELAGYDVLVAATPSEAEQIGREADRPIHLLLTDVVMPDMSGFELSERLQARRPGLRIVYMSGYPKPMFGEGGGDMPGLRFLAKPFDRPSLLRTIRQALDVPDAR